MRYTIAAVTLLQRIAAWMLKIDLDRIIRAMTSTWVVSGNDPNQFLSNGGRALIERLLERGYTYNDLSTALRVVTSEQYGIDGAGQILPTSALPGGGGRKVAPTP